MTTTVVIPVAQLQALLALLEDAAELRQREVADAYRRGRADGVLDQELLRVVSETARVVAEDRLCLDMQTDPLPFRDLVADRRVQVARWVATGLAEDYPCPGRVA